MCSVAWDTPDLAQEALLGVHGVWVFPCKTLEVLCITIGKCMYFLFNVLKKPIGAYICLQAIGARRWYSRKYRLPILCIIIIGSLSVQ